MPDHGSTPKCPACGFTVFNNRYPKCERCGIQLPTNLVLSKEQLQKVLEDERQAALQAQQTSRRKEALASGSSIFGIYSDGGMDSNLGSFDCDAGSASDCN